MKYLKLFNESNDAFKNELQEFCNDNLAYLIDIGFKIIVTNYYDDLNERSYEVKLYRAKKGCYQRYSWEEINDDFIPFLTILNEKYNIIRIKMDFLSVLKYGQDNFRSSFITFPINKMLKDKIKEDKIDFIFIQIKKPS